jgi:hypothetical protein
MNRAEQRRLLVLNHLEAGALVNAEAAELLGVSIRQVRRLRAAYRERGAAALAHGNRGRRPAHALDPANTSPRCWPSTKASTSPDRACIAFWPALGWHRRGSGAPHGIASVGIACRAKACWLQVGGSRHDWLEGRGPYLSLVNGIDDDFERPVGRRAPDCNQPQIVWRRRCWDGCERLCESRWMA